MKYVRKLRNLRKLSIKNIHNITDYGFKKLGKLHKLKEIDISGCYCISKEAMDTLKSKLKNLKIELFNYELNKDAKKSKFSLTKKGSKKIKLSFSSSGGSSQQQVSVIKRAKSEEQGGAVPIKIKSSKNSLFSKRKKSTGSSISSPSDSRSKSVKKSKSVDYNVDINDDFYNTASGYLEARSSPKTKPHKDSKEKKKSFRKTIALDENDDLDRKAKRNKSEDVQQDRRTLSQSTKIPLHASEILGIHKNAKSIGFSTSNDRKENMEHLKNRLDGSADDKSESSVMEIGLRSKLGALGGSRQEARASTNIVSDSGEIGRAHV